MSNIQKIKDRTEEKMNESFLLHLFLNDWKFLAAFAILAPLVIGGLLLIPRVWVVSPEGFRPTVKISGLDYLQSWSLGRTARKQEAREEYDKALYSWEVAISNHPTKIENLRSAIKAFRLSKETTGKQRDRNVNYSLWLLKLNQTNLTDIELIAETLDTARLDELQYVLLKPHEEELSEAARAAYCRTLFNLFQHDQFNEQWERLSAATQNIPKNQMYRTAYEALWSSSVQAAKSRQELEAFAQQPDAVLARQLLLLVFFQEGDYRSYARVLNLMTTAQQARYAHHLGYWSVLAKADRREQALELARNHPVPPDNISDFVNHINFYRSTQALELADEFAQTHLQSFPADTYVFSAYANLLIELEDWNRLREIAITLRKANSQKSALSLSYYLEGTADIKQNRSNSAANAFGKFSDAPQDDGLNSEISIAQELSRLGFPDHAHRMLVRIEAGHNSEPEYWYTRTGCAFQSRDYRDMLNAAEHALALAPENPNYQTALAESLLLVREDPARAIRLTLELTTRQPTSFSHHINHVLALLLNYRIEEAAEYFARIPEEKAPDTQARAAYHYAKFGLEFHQERYQDAYKTAKTIPVELLSDREREWFDQCRATIIQHL